MMRVLLHGWGSRGDVEPAIALGQVLQARGHEVTVAVAEDLACWVKEAGLAVESIPVSIAELSRSEEGIAWLGGQARGPLGEARLMRSFLAAAADPIATMLAGTRGCYDLVVTVPVLLTSMLTIDPRQRLACLLLQPSLATRHGESCVFASRPGVSWTNWLASSLGNLGGLAIVEPIAAATRRLSGAHRPTPAALARAMRRVLHLVASSPLITPAAPDWPDNAVVTGFFRRPSEPWTPPTGLTDFLEAGEPPVFIGFGSMPDPDPKRTGRLIVEAVTDAGMRAVVGRGTAGLGVADTERFHLVDQVPYAHLFTRVRMVVTHGGAGTTAAALAAGTPTVVVPHMGDQGYWGRRIHELGAGPEPIRRHQLTAANLSEALAIASTPSIIATAHRIGLGLATENGATNAAETLEKWAQP